VTDPLEKHAKEQERKACTHEHLQFGRFGFELKCLDCKRRYVVAMDGFDIADFAYGNPALTDGDFRHGTREPARQEPKIR